MTAAKRAQVQKVSETNSSQSARERSGFFVFENRRGEIFRTLRCESSKIVVVYRQDSRRVEVVANTQALDQDEIEYKVLATATVGQVKKAPLEISNVGRIRWIDQLGRLSPSPELPNEEELDRKKWVTWSFGLQIGIVGLLLIAGVLSGPQNMAPEPTYKVTLITEPMVKQIVAPKPEKVVQPSTRKSKTVARQKPRVVAPMNKGKMSGKSSTKVARTKPRQNQFSHNSGVLGVLGGAAGSSVAKSRLNLNAVSSDGGVAGRAAGAGENLARRVYGKGLVAIPSGGGGSADFGSTQYNTRGRGGSGKGGSNYGATSVSLGAKGVAVINSIAGGRYGSVEADEESSEATGGLEMDQIKRVIERNMGQVVYCYELGLQSKPSLAGRVAVRFDIAGTGRVTTSRVAHSSVRSSMVENCITQKVKGWNFPKPYGGVTVAVTYPFNLRRVSQR